MSDVNIYVIARVGQPYMLLEDPDDHPRYLKGKGRLSTKKNGKTDVNFFLVDATGSGLVFKTDANGPIAIAPGTDIGTCPDTGTSDFVVTDPTQQSFSLAAPSANGGRKDFVFKLRIMDGGGQDKSWDPVIENGGGPATVAFNYWLYVLAGALFATAVFGAAYAAGLIR